MTVVRPKAAEPARAYGPHQHFAWKDLLNEAESSSQELGFEAAEFTNAFTNGEKEKVDELAAKWLSCAGEEIASMCGQKEDPEREIKVGKENVYKKLGGQDTGRRTTSIVYR